MTHEELMTQLSLEVISEMPYDDFAHLTNDFDEKDVRTILAKSGDIEIQRSVFASIEKKYIQWDTARDPFNFNIRAINKTMFGGTPTPDYPKYFKDITLSLKYNFLIEQKKEFSMPYVSPVSLRQRIAGTKTTETPDISKYKTHIIELEAEIKQLQAVVKEKDAEIASLKQQPEECQNNDSYNDEQEAKQDEKVLYNKVSHEFFLRLLEKAGLDLNNTGNKTRVGDLWHMVTGKSGDEIRRYCSTRNYINSHTRVDIKRLNEFLQDMKIGDFQLPIS